MARLSRKGAKNCRTCSWLKCGFHTFGSHSVKGLILFEISGENFSVIFAIADFCRVSSKISGESLWIFDWEFWRVSDQNCSKLLSKFLASFWTSENFSVCHWKFLVSFLQEYFSFWGIFFWVPDENPAEFLVRILIRFLRGFIRDIWRGLYFVEFRRVHQQKRGF